MIVPDTTPALAGVDAEASDVVRIRLWNAHNATAVLSEFHTADKVLQRWNGERECPVHFEITYLDGQLIRGSHAFFHKGKRKVLLSTHARRRPAQEP